MTLAAAPRPTRPSAGFRRRVPAGLRRVPAAGTGWVGQLTRFALVGGGASGLQLAAYAFLADAVGVQAANVVSWLVATLLATELHRRFSFGAPGPAHRGGRRGTTDRVDGDHVVGVLTGLATLLLSAAALAALDDPSGTAGVLALVAVNGLVGLLRFAVLRWWLLDRPARGGIGPRRGGSCPRDPSDSRHHLTVDSSASRGLCWGKWTHEPRERRREREFEHR